MKTWAKIDFLGLFFFILGIFCIFCSTSTFVTISVLFLSGITFAHALYKTKYELINFHNALCHYQGILSNSSDGWIAWNENGEYIGASKKIKNLLSIKKYDISIQDVISSFVSESSQEFIYYYDRLQKNQEPFSVNVSTKFDNALQIIGSQITIDNIKTFILWCSDVTDVTKNFHKIEQNFDKSIKEIQQLKHMINAVSIPIWMRNENVEIIDCNDYYASCLDTTKDRIIRNNIPLIPGNLFDKGHSLAENAKKINREQTISQTTVVKGERKKLLLHEIPMQNGYFVGFASDITALDNATDDLNKIVIANYEVLEALSTAIVIFSNNMKLTFFNSSYQRLMKLDEAWLHSNPTFSEVLDECRNNRQLPEHADFQAFKKSQMSLFTSIISPNQELLHLPSGKTYRQVIAPYPLGGLLFMYEDVTDSLVLQRKNNTLLAVQKETIDHLYEGVAVYGSNNRLKIFNKSFVKMWNMEPIANAELIGMHLSDVLDFIKEKLDFGDNWNTFRENAISNLTDRITKTGKLYKNDNSTILFSYVPLPDGSHLHSYIDITATCVVEQAILEKNQALKTAQKLRYEFISCISSELKEPLNVLCGFADLLVHQYFGALNNKQIEYCHCILNAANQLNQLIENLVEMSSVDIDTIKLEKNYFDIELAINDVVGTLIKRAQEKSVNIIKHFNAQSIEYYGDKKRIKQCIFNILLNSIQFTPPGESVSIITESDDAFLKIIVKDGSFRPSNGKKKIFVRANDTKNNKEKNVINMPFVRSLLELHDGTMSACSEAGNHGTVIVCTLPIIVSQLPQHIMACSDENENDFAVEQDFIKCENTKNSDCNKEKSETPVSKAIDLFELDKKIVNQ